MSSTQSPPRQRLGRWFDLCVLLGGVAVLGWALSVFTADPPAHVFHPAAVVVVVLIVVVARFPVVIDNGDGGVEVGFDSCLLMVLLCTTDAHDALILWSVGVLLTQLLSGKRWSSKAFNVGVGLLAGGLAAAVLTAVRGDSIGTARELGAVALAAVAYFAADFIISAASVALQSGAGLRGQLLQRETLIAIACFVPFDALGYLGAVVYRATPWWTQTLLFVPLATLLVATRAVTRGRENARRLGVLFDAAVQAQAVTDRRQVVADLESDARRLLRLRDVEVRTAPPHRGEIGAEVHLGDQPHWVVAGARDRARSTVDADSYALQALAAVASDAWARIRLTDDMVHVARHDPLTDLPNRGILIDRLSEALAAAGDEGCGRVALLFVDLDGFKPVNDQYGHAAGDVVLVELAGRLRGCVRATDTVARVGGDEFAVLFDDVDPAHVGSVWTRMLGCLEQGVEIAGNLVRLSASAGVAFAGPGDSAEGLLRHADLAMYEAKSAGKARLVVYEEAIGRSRLERLVMADDLREAVAGSDIDVVYQPIVAVDSGRIVGVETLARWQRDGVAVPPDVFIKVAEESGLILTLGEVVLAKVVADSTEVREVLEDRELAEHPFRMGVNISARQLQDSRFEGDVRRASAAMSPIGLVLEITERQGVELDGNVLESMQAIRRTGVAFAVDDFGVGFSSISYLADLPVEFLKIDASLVQDIDASERASALLRSVTLMGRTLGLGLVVEGIERDSQLGEVSTFSGGLHAQGYLLHRPMPKAQLLDVLAADLPLASGTGVRSGG